MNSVAKVKRSIGLAIVYERYGHLKIKKLKDAGFEDPPLGNMMIAEPLNDPMLAHSVDDLRHAKLKNTWEVLTPLKVLQVCILLVLLVSPPQLFLLAPAEPLILYELSSYAYSLANRELLHVFVLGCS